MVILGGEWQAFRAFERMFQFVVWGRDKGYEEKRRIKTIRTEQTFECPICG